MGKSSPKPPDPYATAAAQSQANKEAVRESAKVNAVDQFGPWGSTTYQRNPDGTPASQTVSLTPQGDRILDGQMGIAEQLTGKAGEMIGQIPTGPMDISGLPGRQNSIGGDFGAQTKAAQDAVFGKAQALMQPGFQQDRQRLEQSLSDRGIPLDSAAGRAELDRMDRGQSEAMNRSAMDAVMAGSSEHSRLFGLDAASAGFQNQARNDSLTEAMMLRNQPFNEAAALLQGSPSMGMPQFQGQPAYNVAAPDIAGLINQNYAWQSQQSNANRTGMMNGLFGLGSAFLMSDRRLKRDIRPIGAGWHGLPLYLFRYVWGGAHHVGVMAQDAVRIVPQAVARTASGFLAVHYGALREAAQ